MEWPSHLEKLGRFLLWITLSIVCIVALAGVRAQNKAEQELRDEMKKAQSKIEELSKPPKPPRFPLRHMGMFMSTLNQSSAEGQAWFTNVSPRSGFLCAYGVVTNPATQDKTRSLAACKHIEPYSSVHLTFAFAGSELRELCKNTACGLGIEEAPDVPE